MPGNDDLSQHLVSSQDPVEDWDVIWGHLHTKQLTLSYESSVFFTLRKSKYIFKVIGYIEHIGKSLSVKNSIFKRQCNKKYTNKYFQLIIINTIYKT